MRKLSKAVCETLRSAREKTLTNAWHLLQTTVELFEQEQYATACFLAMTAIEEVGKLFVLLCIQLRPPLSGLNTKELNKFLLDHLNKALQAAAWSLYINAGADQRHGVHPVSGMHRTSGVVLLARPGRWMDIRNACLYTDVDLTSNLAFSPSDFITRAHAYYFICMGFEVLAEQAESGLGSDREGCDVSKSIQFWQDRIGDVKKFMERWSNTVNLDCIDFLADPGPLRKEGEKRESKKAKKRRNTA